MSGSTSRRLPRTDMATTTPPPESTNPGHYQASGLEAIEVIEAFALDFCLGNAVKYICRHGRKSDGATAIDIKKARWYLTRRIEHLTGISPSEQAEVSFWERREMFLKVVEGFRDLPGDPDPGDPMYETLRRVFQMGYAAAYEDLELRYR